jgi:hypothetical protein
MAYSRYRAALFALIGILLFTPDSSFAQTDRTQEEGFAALLAQAEKGDQHSQFLAGIIYLETGGRENSFQGATWCRKSALQGNRLGQYHLATCYESGTGVPKSLIEAYAFYNLASPVDNSALWKRDGLVRKGMSREDIEAGMRRTMELQREIEANVAAKRAADPVVIEPAVTKTSGGVDSKPPVEVATRQAPVDNDITNTPWLLLALACVIIGVLLGGLMFKKTSATVSAASSGNPESETKPASRGFFFYWAASSLAILTFLSALGYLNGGASGFAFQLGRGLILAPIGGLVLGVIWKMASK